MILLQNIITDIITKCNSSIITRCDGNLLQNVSGFLFQNATVSLKSTRIIKRCVDFITKCDSYYKTRRYRRFKKFPRPIKSSSVTKYFVHIKVKKCLLNNRRQY